MPGGAAMKYAAAVLAVLSVLLGLAWQGERASHARTREQGQKRMAFLHEQAKQAEALQRKAEKELSDAAIAHASRVDGLLSESRRAAVRHAGDSERLRDEARAFAARSGAGCPTAPSAADIEAGPSAALVLADLLGRADARATELAQTADEARIRGLACESDYDRAQRVKD